MKNITLDSILLFTLLTPFIMTYRLSPGTTPYWLFGLIFAGLFFYMISDLLKFNSKHYSAVKNVILWLLIIGVIGSAFTSSIIVRHQTAPVYGVHDILLQQEAAIRFLLDGQNPYAASYFGTLLEQWHYSDEEVNPALYHFVMQPFYLIFALPFYAFSMTAFGFFDGRMPLLFLFFVLLVLAWKLVVDEQKRRLFLVLLAFNPGMLGFILEGRSDIFMFTFLFIGLYLLYRQKYFTAGVPLALAFAVKQSVWPILPFYLAFIYFKTKTITRTCILILPFIITLTVFVIPFLLWDTRAFLDSTIFYLSGNAPNSYPISGYGLGKVLHDLGIIKDIHQYFPFHILQLLFGLPLLMVFIRFLRREPNVGRLIFVYGLFLLVFWYLSRYFNNSHLGYLSMVFITAYFWPEEK